MKVFKYIFSALTIALLSGCGGNEPVEPVEPTPTSEQICFSIPVPKTTKTPIVDMAQIQDSGVTSVFVYGTRGGNNINGTYYNGGQIYYAATGIWSLSYGTATWSQGASYTFWGWAYSPTNAVSSSDLAITNNGLGIEVTQPTSYSADNSVDYMLAHQFPATATSSTPVRGPIVTLEMEHAMAMVEVYVVKNPAMDNATVTNITLENFYNAGALTCTTHSVYGDGTKNAWGVNHTGTPNTTYTLTGSMELTADRDTPAVMKFIAIPQQLSVSTKLTVDYSILENDGGTTKTLSQSFQLYNYPYDWETGKRNIYTLTVDTSIHLYATIEPWPTVSYVNGTILPEIK